MPTRNVNLTPQLDKLVQRSIASGEYGNASEVVRDALRLLHEKQKAKRAWHQQLKKAYQRGIEAIERGEVTRIDDPEELHAFMERLAEEGRRMHSSKEKRRA